MLFFDNNFNNTFDDFDTFSPFTTMEPRFFHAQKPARVRKVHRPRTARVARVETPVSMFDSVFAPLPRATESRKLFRDPFFGSDFGVLEQDFGHFDGFDKEFAHFGEDFEDFGFGPKRKNVRRPKLSEKKHFKDLGKENIDPNFAQNDNMLEETLPLPEPARPSYQTPIFTEKKTAKKPQFFEKKFESSSVYQNGEGVTYNKGYVAENGKKVEDFAEKIFEDKNGNREITQITPEKWESERHAILYGDDEVLREIPRPEFNAIEPENAREKSEDEIFEEKIRNSSLNTSGSEGENPFQSIHF